MCGAISARPMARDELLSLHRNAEELSGFALCTPEKLGRSRANAPPRKLGNLLITCSSLKDGGLK